MKTDAGSISAVKASKLYVSLTQTIKEMKKILCLTIKCYTKAVIKEKCLYHVFDPHSMDSEGTIKANGKAVLALHCCFEN